MIVEGSDLVVERVLALNSLIELARGVLPFVAALSVFVSCLPVFEASDDPLVVVVDEVPKACLVSEASGSTLEGVWDYTALLHETLAEVADSAFAEVAAVGPVLLQ